MPTEISISSETNSKRKAKNKIPKRLQHRNRENDTRIEQRKHSSQEPSIPRKERIHHETGPFLLDALRSSLIPKSSETFLDSTSIAFWKYSTHRALQLLQKLTVHRRNWLIERHHERVQTVQNLLEQREKIQLLVEENHSMNELIDSLRHELTTKTECIELYQIKLHDRDELMRDNEQLRIQMKSVEQKLERFTLEYSKKIEDHRRYTEESTEQIQSLLDEIERIKRDLILEEYRKQEAERKVRVYDEKLRNEQILNKKLQQENSSMKSDLKSIQNKYDALQIEMLAMHKANYQEISLLPSKDTNEQSELSHEQTIDTDESIRIQRPKRKTRDRTGSSTSTNSNGSEKKTKLGRRPSKFLKAEKTDSSSTRSKRKTAKKYLPMLTVTQASPSADSSASVEQDTSQYLLSSSTNTTSDSNTTSQFHHRVSATETIETSGESRPVTPQRKTPSRYQCRRAQRPVKLVDTSDQSKQ